MKLAISLISLLKNDISHSVFEIAVFTYIQDRHANSATKCISAKSIEMDSFSHYAGNLCWIKSTLCKGQSTYNLSANIVSSDNTLSMELDINSTAYLG